MAYCWLLQCLHLARMASFRSAMEHFWNPFNTQVPKQRRQNSRISYYANGVATFQLLLRAGDVAEKPGPSASNKKRPCRNDPHAIQHLFALNVTRLFTETTNVLSVLFVSIRPTLSALGLYILNIYALPRLRIGLVPRVPSPVLPFFGHDNVGLSVPNCQSAVVSVMEDSHVVGLQSATRI